MLAAERPQRYLYSRKFSFALRNERSSTVEEWVRRGECCVEFGGQTVGIKISEVIVIPASALSVSVLNTVFYYRYPSRLYSVAYWRNYYSMGGVLHT